MPHFLRVSESDRVLERPGAADRIDYDLNARAFEYHSAIEEPDAKKFHLDSFAGFHSATGVRVGTAQVEELADERGAFDGLFGSANDLQRAFVLTEVLSRPLSLRGRRTAYPH